MANLIIIPSLNNGYIINLTTYISDSVAPTAHEIIYSSIREEGLFQDNYTDRGNWTSGRVGKGILKGTKYGISAMSYPDLDIENLSIEEAFNIYLNDYWCKFKIELAPIEYRMILFDMTIQHGFGNASMIIQNAINYHGGNVKVDNYAGKLTYASLSRIRPPLNTIRNVRSRFILNGIREGKIPNWTGLIKRSLEV